jgi:hypothetical protein
MLFLGSEGVDQITTSSGALATGETATYTVSPDDSDGIMNLFVKIQPDDICAKVCQASARPVGHLCSGKSSDHGSNP